MKRVLTIVLSICLALGLNVASAAITPPTSGNGSDTNPNWQLIVLADDRVTAAAWNSTAALTAPYRTCGLHYTTVISDAMALTLTLQGSNNGKNWVSYATDIITTTTTEQNNIYIYENPPTQFTRVATTVSNTASFTETLFLFCR